MMNAASETPHGSRPGPRTEGTNARPSLDALTSVRFFAAAWVIAYHQNHPWSLLGPMLASLPRPITNLVRSGHCAVGLFFILSGFVLAYNYCGREWTARSFWIARLARIYPVYLLGLALAAPLIVWRTAAHAVPPGFTLSTLACCLTLTQAWVAVPMAFWNGPGWSLSAEAFFYLVFPTLLPLLRKGSKKGRGWGLALMVALSLAGPLACMVLHVPAGSAFWNWARFSPLVRLPEFLAGVLLGLIFLSDLSRNSAPGTSWTILGVLALIVCCALVGPTAPRLFLVLNNAAPLLWGMPILYGLARGGVLQRMLSHRWLVRLGEASYAAYILHIPLGSFVFAADNATLHLAGSHPAILFCIYFALVIGASLLVHHFIEEPARQYLRQKFASRPSPGNHGLNVAQPLHSITSNHRPAHIVAAS